MTALTAEKLDMVVGGTKSRDNGSSGDAEKIRGAQRVRWRGNPVFGVGYVLWLDGEYAMVLFAPYPDVMTIEVRLTELILVD